MYKVIQIVMICIYHLKNNVFLLKWLSEASAYAQCLCILYVSNGD